jgi:hypothetical protein
MFLPAGMLLRSQRAKTMLGLRGRQVCPPAPRCSLLLENTMSEIPRHVIAESIMDTLNASGPQTFQQIYRYCLTQMSPEPHKWEVARTLSGLITATRVYLYDTGDAFDSTHRQ